MQKKPFDSKLFLERVTHQPGVYCMLGKGEEVLYVGKAKNLAKRLAQYFSGKQSLKTQSLVKQIEDIQVTVTATEREALLLENNFIKQFRPRFNILLRDDKSFPYIFFSESPFPRLLHCRGKKQAGTYFGPYASGSTLKNIVEILQKCFRLRVCDDPFFKSRLKPCLQYQLQRCTAPCVGLITEEQYAKDVEAAQDFLRGNSNEITKDLITRMEQASEARDFEQAIALRDLITHIRSVQDKQMVLGDYGNIDVLGFAFAQDMACIQCLSIRQGSMVGSRPFVFKVPLAEEPRDMITHFLLQYYDPKEAELDWPHNFIVAKELVPTEAVLDILMDRAGRVLKWGTPSQPEAKRWLTMARLSAEQALEQKKAVQEHFHARFKALETMLSSQKLKRLECFDVSHFLGQHSYAACVVFNTEGPLKKEYRLFKIQKAPAGDDLSALKEALMRRYNALLKEQQEFPSLILIDGGKHQLIAAKTVLSSFGFSGTLLAMSKGKARRVGHETLWITDMQPTSAPLVLEWTRAHNAFHLLQHLRDEAHRFALKAHRRKRDKNQRQRVVQTAGVGDTKQRYLLSHFGGLQGLMSASVDEIMKVPGIGKTLAMRIYEALHGT